MFKMTEEQLTEYQARLRAGAATKPAKKESGQSRLQALGRLKPGEMNKTEQRYHDHLEAEKAAGRVLWFAFEAVKLKIAHNTHLTVDFFVMLADGRLEAHDVKGAKAIFSDDARVKMKVAADKFPWQFVAVYPKKASEGGGWERDEF